MPIGVGSPLRRTTGRSHVVTSTSVKQLSQRATSIGRVLSSPQPQAVIAGGRVLAQGVTSTATGMGVSSFAGKPWTGYRARLVHRGAPVRAVVRPRGSVGGTSILNAGAKPHIIGPKALGTRNAWRTDPQRVAARGAAGYRRSTAAGGGPRRLSWPGRQFPARYVSHPGMKGRMFIGPAIIRWQPVAAQVFQREVGTAVLEKAFQIR